MAKSGNKGSIIVDSSSVASRTSALPFAAGGGVYAASKAGANMLMKYAAIEVRVCSSRAVFYLTFPTLASPESIRGLFEVWGREARIMSLVRSIAPRVIDADGGVILGEGSG